MTGNYKLCQFNYYSVPKLITFQNWVHTYKNHKTDKIFEKIAINPVNVIAAIHSVGGDGNCGFRAVSFDVYKDQTKWLKVEYAMFETYIKYCDTLYKNIQDENAEHFKKDMITRLNSKKSPCLNLEDRHLWFGTLDCPQIVADTYEGPVIVLSYVVNQSNNGESRENHEIRIFLSPH